MLLVPIEPVARCGAPLSGSTWNRGLLLQLCRDDVRIVRRLRHDLTFDDPLGRGVVVGLDCREDIFALDDHRTLALEEGEAHAVIDKAETAMLRGCELTRKLLTFSRKNPIEAQPVDLGSVIEEVVALLSQTVNRRIEFETDISDERAIVFADASQMTQILMNLCLNARDALTDAGDHSRSVR